MEGYEGQPPGAMIPRYWSPGWNSVQALNKFQSEVGGPLRGGDPGLRLIEPSQVQPASYFPDVPEAFQRRKGEWLVVPIYHIFGSEELSAITPAIAERIPEPCLWLNDEDAADLHVGPGWEVRLDLASISRALTVKLEPSLPRGIAGLAVGLPGSVWVHLPSWGKVQGLRTSEK
jgi:NADH-quinone oxidoreductase subunit G